MLYSVIDWCANLYVFQHETELLEDSLALPGFASFPGKFGSSEDEFMDSDDVSNSRPHTRPASVHNTPFTDSKPGMVSAGIMKCEFRRWNTPYGCLRKWVFTYHCCQIKITFFFTSSSSPFSLLGRDDKRTKLLELGLCLARYKLV